MLKSIITGPASNDLAAIWQGIAADNRAAADRFVERFDSRVASLCKHPEHGERDERVGGVRRVLIGSYLMFYEHDQSSLRVLRLYHGARRIEDLRLDQSS